MFIYLVKETEAEWNTECDESGSGVFECHWFTVWTVITTSWFLVLGSKLLYSHVSAFTFNLSAVFRVFVSVRLLNLDDC